MLRQIARLGHVVPSISSKAIAVAVYASANDDTVVAREAGFEGVACVDDAARALELYCELWRATKLPWALAWCEGLLDFVLAMQDDDGRWVNFIRDWGGTPNRVGRTSVAGGEFWQARAMLSLATASRALDDARIDRAFRDGLAHLVDNVAPSDVRSLHILAALSMSRDGRYPELRSVLSSWCDELAACRHGEMLMNSTMEVGEPHLWAHFQESALADASVFLDRPELLDVARRSAEAVFVPIIRSGFDRPLTSPFDVATSYDVMIRLAASSGETAYLDLAGEAREWFNGRNPSGQPVYDREKGRVADGIDGGRLNTHSGAESNIVGAQTLFSEVKMSAGRYALAEVNPPGWT
ncbi:MAG: hypothetical protein WA786_01950 [Acidimicrobiales bacterium]